MQVRSKLRNWWPSDVNLMLDSTSALHNTSTCTAAPMSALIPSADLSKARAPPNSEGHAANSLHSSTNVLRLSEVAAALNAMPCQPLSSSTPTMHLHAGNVTSSSTAFSSSTLSRPVPKLGSTQSHKEELLRKLLSRSESSSDLRIGIQHKASRSPPLRPSPSPSPAVLTPSQVPAQEVGGKEQILLSEVDSLAANMPATDARLCKLDDSVDSRKRKRGTMSLTLKSLDMSLKQPPLPALELSSIQRESLTRREIHIYSERQRRKGMTHLYSILHSLLPDAKSKTDRCTVLTDAIHFIHELQSRIDEFGKKKCELLAEIGEQLSMDSATTPMANEAESAQQILLRSAADELSDDEKEEILSAAGVVVRFCGRDAFITLNSSKTRGVWSAILQVLHEQEMDILNVTLSTGNDMIYHCVHTKVSSTASEVHSNDLQRILQEVVLTYAMKEHGSMD